MLRCFAKGFATAFISRPGASRASPALATPLVRIPQYSRAYQVRLRTVAGDQIFQTAKFRWSLSPSAQLPASHSQQNENKQKILRRSGVLQLFVAIGGYYLVLLLLRFLVNPITYNSTPLQFVWFHFRNTLITSQVTFVPVQLPTTLTLRQPRLLDT